MQRTYFVKGHRVDAYRDSRGDSSWACDCVEYFRLRARGLEGSCEHLRTVTAATSSEQAHPGPTKMSQLATPKFAVPDVGHETQGLRLT